MKSTKTHTIKGAGYPIFIGENLENVMRSFFKKSNYSRYFVLTDENTQKYCLPLFIKRSGIDPEVITIRSGEKNKTLQSCEKIWEILTYHQADRDSLLINLGGGVIGDLGGFAAACYKRGIDFIQVPTTLLSMVDSSVGAKTGIDFLGLKNQIGLFAMPKAVFADTVFLGSLPNKQIQSGFAEIIKHALIADNKMFTDLQLSNDNIIYPKLIAKNIEIKKRIVQKDPTEKSTRKALNFGHTLGHAMESLSLKKDNNALLHGEAIIAGMMMETYLSFKKKLLTKRTFLKIYTFLKQRNTNRSISKNEMAEIYSLILNDKKNSRSEIRFTLLSDIGKFIINQAVMKVEIKKALLFYNRSLKKNDLQDIL